MLETIWMAQSHVLLVTARYEGVHTHVLKLRMLEYHKRNRVTRPQAS